MAKLKKKEVTLEAMDLRVRPPRSARVRLGGFVILPRLLDKGRAVLAGTQGDYNYACPLDQHFFRYVGVDPDALKKQLLLGKGDVDILHWIHANGTQKPMPWQIAAWSAYHEQRGPTDVESREFFNGYHKKSGLRREDIASWFDVLDLDDYASFGGRV